MWKIVAGDDHRREGNWNEGLRTDKNNWNWVIERTGRIWVDDNVWSAWMNKHYVHDRSLQSIGKRYDVENDSAKQGIDCPMYGVSGPAHLQLEGERQFTHNCKHHRNHQTAEASRPIRTGNLGNSINFFSASDGSVWQ